MLLGVCRKRKVYRSNWADAGEKVAEGLFCDMRRQVCDENVGGLICRRTLIDTFRGMNLRE